MTKSPKISKQKQLESLLVAKMFAKMNDDPVFYKEVLDSLKEEVKTVSSYLNKVK
jgi:hypothetical protein